jgi:3'-phosphoadenosine 5'-phosphosulfate sulfotransferase (PAPS reductase)/FAD synthetase
MHRITIPEQFRDDPSIVYVCNISGGKDSTAAELALVEAGIPHRRVFADTAWEAPEPSARRRSHPPSGRCARRRRPI